MTQVYKTLSVVYPGGSKIASGEKTIEVRSWTPDLSPEEDLLIVENQHYLKKEDETDPHGSPVAIVKIKAVRPYLKEDIPLACASRWEEGYYSWELSEVRSISASQEVLAARGIYLTELKLKSNP